MIKQSTITTVLLEEFKDTCDKIRLAIDNMDESIWNIKTNKWSYAKNLYHIIETIEFYSYDSPKDMETRGELGIKTANKTNEEIENELKTKHKEFFYNYLEQVQKLIITTIAQKKTEEFIKPDLFEEFGFKSCYHKYSYVLRHSMIHAGELNKTLRDLGKTRIKWL